MNIHSFPQLCMQNFQVNNNKVKDIGLHKLRILNFFLLFFLIKCTYKLACKIHPKITYAHFSLTLLIWGVNTTHCTMVHQQEQLYD